MELITCNTCNSETRHNICFKKSLGKEVVDSGGLGIQWKWEVWFEVIYEVLECCGCQSLTLRRSVECSEWDGERKFEFYPPRTVRILPAWHSKIPDTSEYLKNIKELLEEVYLSLNSNTLRLALMGCRTLIDLFMLEKIGDQGGFDQKLKKLVDGGYLGKDQQKFLQVALDAGHAAAHRAYKPKLEVVNHVLDVIENLIQLYVLEETSHSVSSEIPPRRNQRP